MSYVLKAHIECKIPIGMVMKPLLARPSPVLPFIVSIDFQLNHTPLSTNLHTWLVGSTFIGLPRAM